MQVGLDEPEEADISLAGETCTTIVSTQQDQVYSTINQYKCMYKVENYHKIVLYKYYN